MTTTAPVPELAADLRRHLVLCQELLALTTDENKALQHPDMYEPFQHYQQRKSLLARLDQSLNALRKRGAARQTTALAQRTPNPEVNHLFEANQDLIVKVLMLDRENQQALLRRGLVPARHVSSAAGQRPHFVASLYQRNAAGSFGCNRV